MSRMNSAAGHARGSRPASACGWRKPIRLLAVLCLLLTACAPHTEETELFVFGTLAQVRTWTSDEAARQAATREIQQAWQQLHVDWHAWEPSTLMQLNAALAAGQAFKAPPDLLALLQRCRSLEDRSLGYFNPASGRLIGLWGFHTSDYPVTTPEPAAGQILDWLAQSPSLADLRFDGEELRSRNSAVQIDLGGVAKGYAADLAIEILARHGIDTALVNVGGDLRARGSEKHPWRVGVLGAGDAIIGAVSIRSDEALFTSGSSQRYRQQAGSEHRYPHILDPHSGRPAKGLASVTVLTTDAVLGDAAATALFAAGPEKWREVAASLGVAAVLVMDADGQIILTPEMAARLEPDPGHPDWQVLRDD